MAYPACILPGPSAPSHLILGTEQLFSVVLAVSDSTQPSGSGLGGKVLSRTGPSLSPMPLQIPALGPFFHEWLGLAANHRHEE